MKHKFWESYYDENSLQDEVSQGIVQAHFYFPETDKPARFVEEILQALIREFGELSNTGVYAEEIAKSRRFLYSATAFNESGKMNHEQDTVLPSGIELMKKTVERIYRVDFFQVEAGLTASWANPYVANGDQNRWSMNAIIEKMAGYFVLKLAFSKASMWFSIFARPLFSSDGFVKNNLGLDWNKNERGVIVPREAHLLSNRKKMANKLANISTKLGARAAFAGYLTMRYDWNHNTCYVRKMYDQKNDISIVLYFDMPADAVFSTGDLEDIMKERYFSLDYRSHQHYFDRQHFGHITIPDLEGH